MQPGGKNPGSADKPEVGPPDAKNMNHQTIESTSDIKLNARAQALIGQRLRTVYDELVQEPVPDHLLKLLEELEQKEGQS